MAIDVIPDANDKVIMSIGGAMSPVSKQDFIDGFIGPVNYDGVPSMRHCSTNNNPHTIFSATNKYIEGYSYHIALTDMRNWVTGYWNGRVDVTQAVNEEVALGASNATLIVESEYPAGSGLWETMVFPNAGSIAPNAVAACAPMAQYIPRGGISRRRYYFTNPDGVPYSATSCDRQNAFGTGTTPPGYVRDKVIGANMAASFLPLYTVCLHNQPAANWVGDSHTAGTGDTADYSHTLGQIGREVGLVHGYANLAVPSETVAKAINSYSVRGLAAAFGTYNIVYLGTNDLYGGALASAAHANIQTLLALPCFAGKPTAICEITPNSTGTFTSEGGQTTNAPFQTQRALFNITGENGINNCWAWLRISRAIESLTTPGIFQAPDGRAETSDGLHLNRMAQLRKQSAGAVLPALAIAR